MINLAGYQHCDGPIEGELIRAGVEIVRGERSTGEVATTITGKLGPFEFRRAWYYWVATGMVPLALAKELYADPAGRLDVRAGGDWTAPDPENSYVTRYYTADGKEIFDLANKAEIERYRDRSEGDEKQHYAALLEKHAFHDNPAEIGKPFVSSYHIDSDVGLRVFADAIKKHGLHLPEDERSGCEHAGLPRVGIGPDANNVLVVVVFGLWVKRMGCTPIQARQIAAGLIECAETLEDPATAPE